MSSNLSQVLALYSIYENHIFRSTACYPSSVSQGNMAFSHDPDGSTSALSACRSAPCPVRWEPLRLSEDTNVETELISDGWHRNNHLRCSSCHHHGSKTPGAHEMGLNEEPATVQKVLSREEATLLRLLAGVRFRILRRILYTQTMLLQSTEL